MFKTTVVVSLYIGGLVKRNSTKNTPAVKKLQPRTKNGYVEKHVKSKNEWPREAQ